MVRRFVQGIESKVAEPDEAMAEDLSCPMRMGISPSKDLLSNCKAFLKSACR